MRLVKAFGLVSIAVAVTLQSTSADSPAAATQISPAAVNLSTEKPEVPVQQPEAKVETESKETPEAQKPESKETPEAQKPESKETPEAQKTKSAEKPKEDDTEDDTEEEEDVEDDKEEDKNATENKTASDPAAKSTESPSDQKNSAPKRNLRAAANYITESAGFKEYNKIKGETKVVYINDGGEKNEEMEPEEVETVEVVEFEEPNKNSNGFDSLLHKRHHQDNEDLHAYSRLHPREIQHENLPAVIPSVSHEQSSSSPSVSHEPQVRLVPSHEGRNASPSFSHETPYHSIHIEPIPLNHGSNYDNDPVIIEVNSDTPSSPSVHFTADKIPMPAPPPASANDVEGENPYSKARVIDLHPQPTETHKELQ